MKIFPSLLGVLLVPLASGALAQKYVGGTSPSLPQATSTTTQSGLVTGYYGPLYGTTTTPFNYSASYSFPQFSGQLKTSYLNIEYGYAEAISTAKLAPTPVAGAASSANLFGSGFEGLKTFAEGWVATKTTINYQFEVVSLVNASNASPIKLDASATGGAKTLITYYGDCCSGTGSASFSGTITISGSGLATSFGAFAGQDLNSQTHLTSYTYNPGPVTFTVQPNQIYDISITTSAFATTLYSQYIDSSTGNLYSGGWNSSANVLLDPYLMFDSSDGDKKNYKIIVSDGVGNSLAAPGPRPGAGLFGLAFLAFLGLWTKSRDCRSL